MATETKTRGLQRFKDHTVLTAFPTLSLRHRDYCGLISEEAAGDLERSAGHLGRPRRLCFPGIVPSTVWSVSSPFQCLRVDYLPKNWFTYGNTFAVTSDLHAAESNGQSSVLFVLSSQEHLAGTSSPWKCHHLASRYRTALGVLLPHWPLVLNLFAWFFLTHFTSYLAVIQTLTIAHFFSLHSFPSAVFAASCV